MTLQKIQLNKAEGEKISTLFVVYLFFVIFRPPIIKFNTTYLIVILNVMILAFYVIKHDVVCVSKEFVSSFIGFVPFVIYFILLHFLHIVLAPANAPVLIQACLGLVKTWFYILIVVLSISAIVDMLNINLNGYVKHLAVVFAIQLILVLLSYFIPQVKSLFLELIYNNVSSETVITATRQDSYFRCYGLADNLFDSFGYISALAIVVFMNYGITKKKIVSLILSFLLLVLPLLNARTGLLLAFAGMVVVFFQNFDLRKIAKYFIIIGTAIIVIAVVYKKLPIEITRWIEVGIDATVKLVHGNKESVYSEILLADLIWPSSILFGAGAAPEVISTYVGIDSGIVQSIWRFGLIGLLFLFAGFFHMFHTKSKDHGYILPLAVIFLLYLFKLYGLFNLGSVPLIYMLPVLLRKEKEGWTCL